MKIPPYRPGLCSPGLYVMWSADKKRAYVGETMDIHARMRAHRLCMLLADCTFELIRTFPVKSSRKIRWLAEQKQIAKLRDSGISVVNSYEFGNGQVP